MPKVGKYNENSCGLNILLDIALCGEIPWVCRHLFKYLSNENGIIQFSDRTISFCLSELKKDKMISMVGSGKNKMIRLKKTALKFIEKYDFDNNTNYLKHYLFMSDNHSFRGSNNPKANDRKIKTAEIAIILKSISVNIYKFQKKTIYYGNNPDENKNKINPADISFYFAKEFKSLPQENDDENETSLIIHFSKIMGLLITEAGEFPVYHIGDSIFKWNLTPEKKASNVLITLLKYSVDGVVEKIKEHNIDSKKMQILTNNVLLFADSLDSIIDSNNYLYENDDKNLNKYQKMKEESKYKIENDGTLKMPKLDYQNFSINSFKINNLINMNSSYDSNINFNYMYIIPTKKEYIQESQLLLQFFMIPDWDKKIWKYLAKKNKFRGSALKNFKYLIKDNLSTENNTIIHYQFLDCNATTLLNLDQYIYAYINHTDFIIHCYDWQKEFITYFIMNRIKYLSNKNKKTFNQLKTHIKIDSNNSTFDILNGIFNK